MTQLILVENEVNKYGWKDETGSRYHYPNKYINLIKEGRRFIYYRGSREKSGERRIPEYFGTGIISTIYRDDAVSLSEKKYKWRWYCEITDYIPFKNPVPFKRNGVFLENFKHDIQFRMGVRAIDDATFNNILILSGVAPESTVTHSTEEELYLSFPSIDDVQPSIDELSIPQILLPNNIPKNFSGFNNRRYNKKTSKLSKKIGDRAEELVKKWLENNLPSPERESIRWVSKEGETPGWDIEYIDANSRKIKIEVKGTSGNVFNSFELTAQEKEAAEEYTGDFWLLLVRNCLDFNPRITKIVNPINEIKKGTLKIEPIQYRIWSS